jgi:hypothetical protein
LSTIASTPKTTMQSALYSNTAAARQPASEAGPSATEPNAAAQMPSISPKIAPSTSPARTARDNDVGRLVIGAAIGIPQDYPRRQRIRRPSSRTSAARPGTA